MELRMILAFLAGGRKLLSFAMMTAFASAAMAVHIDTTGCYRHADFVVGDVEISSVSVDTASETVFISWQVSSTEGVAGYCICSGEPCLLVDTVWGADNNSYYCFDHRIDQVKVYKMFAIDSCLHGGMLSDGVGNIVLNTEFDSCRRSVLFRWNRSRSSEERYELYLDIDGEPFVTSVVGDTVWSKTFDREVQAVKARVAAVDGDVRSWSNERLLGFIPADSCGLSPEDDVPVTFFVPNIIAPHSGNDFAVRFPDGVATQSYSLYVYNRMGYLVHSSSDPFSTWGGTYKGKMLPQGVYVWYMEFSVSGTQYRRTGTVLLLR